MSERYELIRARQERGLSRQEMGKLAGVNRHMVFAVEVGHRNPSLVTMRRWIKALGDGASMDLFGSERLDDLRTLRDEIEDVLPGHAAE